MIHKATGREVVLDRDGVRGEKIQTQNGCEYVHLTLQAGSTVTSHSLDFPVTFYVLSGSGVLYLDGAPHEAETGDLAEVKAGATREWRNVGTEPLSCLVVKHIGELQ
jgi:quercetin dioxygenase-like cupin family protein